MGVSVAASLYREPSDLHTKSHNPRGFAHVGREAGPKSLDAATNNCVARIMILVLPFPVFGEAVAQPPTAVPGLIPCLASLPAILPPAPSPQAASRCTCAYALVHIFIRNRTEVLIFLRKRADTE